MAQDFKDFVLQVKERADIVSIINRYVPLKKAGARYVGVCPFHDDHSPSMNVTPQMGMYKCFVCGAKGDIFNFLMEYEKLSFIDALKAVCQETGMTLPEHFAESGSGKSTEERSLITQCFSLAQEYFQSNLKKSPLVLKYLEVRGIKAETQKQFALGVAPMEWEGFLKYANHKGFKKDLLLKAGLIKENDSHRLRDCFVNRLIFPIWNLSNYIVGFGGRTLDKDGKPKYLNSAESSIYQKSRILYGLNFARNDIAKKGEVILVEGYMDVISLWQVGLQNTVATSGTALTEAHSEIIARFAKKVYLFFDGDKPGRAAVEKALPLLLSKELEIRIPKLPPEHDPDSYALAFGLEKTSQLLSESQNMVEFLVAPHLTSLSSYSPEEKHNLLTHIRSLLSHIPSDFVRNEYHKQLHHLMDLPLPLGTRGTPIGTSKGAPTAYPPDRRAPARAAPNRQPAQFSPKINVEWQLAYLLLASEDACRFSIEWLDIAWIIDEEARDLIDRALAYFDEEGCFKLSRFLDQVPQNLANHIENMILPEMVEPETAKKQLIDTLAAVKKKYIQRSMKDLSYQIRNHQIDRLEGMKKFTDFQKQLKSIYNSFPA